MRSVFVRVARWLVVPVLLGLGITTGGADGIVGWFVLGWMLFRGGPGMWADVRRFFSWSASRRFSLFRRGRSVGDGLNA